VSVQPQAGTEKDKLNYESAALTAELQPRKNQPADSLLVTDFLREIRLHQKSAVS